MTSDKQPVKSDQSTVNSSVSTSAVFGICHVTMDRHVARQRHVVVQLTRYSNSHDGSTHMTMHMCVLIVAWVLMQMTDARRGSRGRKRCQTTLLVPLETPPLPIDCTTAAAASTQRRHLAHHTSNMSPTRHHQTPTLHDQPPSFTHASPTLHRQPHAS